MPVSSEDVLLFVKTLNEISNYDFTDYSEKSQDPPEYKMAVALVFASFVFYSFLIWYYFLGKKIDWGNILSNYAIIIIIVVLAVIILGPLIYYYVVLSFNKPYSIRKDHERSD